jgi:uncharacterized protein (TIGR01655 family)
MKNLKIIIALIVILIVIGFVGIKGKEYYDDRYVGTDYYLQIPVDQDMTLETMHSNNGEDVGTGKEYKLIAYNEDGESKTVEFSVYGDETALLKPGTYLKVTASNQIVLKEKIISREEVPDQALSLIEKES